MLEPKKVLVCFLPLQSLSAAHLLATQHSQSVTPQTKMDLVPPSAIEEAVLPPEFQSLLESCRNEVEALGAVHDSSYICG
jgi:hypothetical protein